VTDPQYDQRPEQGYDDQRPEQGYDQRPEREATSDDAPTAEPDIPAAEPHQAEPAADPRVRDAVRRLDGLSDLPPAEHVEIYEAVHSSLQESLADASRQADESPSDGSPPS
jgi:hypothetical protein